MAPTSWRNTLSLSILLLWWVERYSEQCDWWRPCDCFRAALSLRTSAIWKPALQFKRVKQDIHICDNYLFKCLGQWIMRRKKKSRSDLHHASLTSHIEKSVAALWKCTDGKRQFCMCLPWNTTPAPLVHFYLLYLNPPPKKNNNPSAWPGVRLNNRSLNSGI